MYVLKNDYRGRISTDLLNILLSEDEAGILAQSSKIAEDTIATHTAAMYDIAPEFLKAGLLRNYYTLSMAINIALYNIYNIADDESIPEKIIKNYDDTMDDLVKISIGKAQLSLPPKPNDNIGGGGTPGDDENASTTGKGLRRYGSLAKRTHNP